MAPAEGNATVEVVFCPAPHIVDLRRLRLPLPARAIDAVRASGLLADHGLDEDGLTLGIWGRSCEPGQPLRERDRVEIYRPLQVDPKEARRLRYKGKRQRAAVSGSPTR